MITMQKLNVNGEQTFLVALNGLHSNIRQHVIQHDPTTIEDIQKWFRVTEVSQEEARGGYFRAYTAAAHPGDLKL